MKKLKCIIIVLSSVSIYACNSFSFGKQYASEDELINSPKTIQNTINTKLSPQQAATSIYRVFDKCGTDTTSVFRAITKLKRFNLNNYRISVLKERPLTGKFTDPFAVVNVSKDINFTRVEVIHRKFLINNNMYYDHVKAILSGSDSCYRSKSGF